MHLLCFLAHRSLGKSVHDTNLTDCNHPGKLPAPQIFLNVSAAQEGDTVAVRCTLSSNISATTFFLCKDGKYNSAHKATPHDVTFTWTFQISKQSAGQYSCGFKIKDSNNQETMSAISAPVTVQLGNHPKSNSNSISTGESNHSAISSNHFKVLKWILLAAPCAVLILAALLCFSVKKVLSQRFSREQTPVKNRNSLTTVENAQYASIVEFHQTASPPFQNAETQYAMIAPPKHMSGLTCEPA